MKISKSQLIAMNACEGGLERFIEQTKGTKKPVEVTSLIGGKNTVGDLVWLACKLLPTDKVIRFSCDCALINIELIKRYTSDYGLIVEFLNKTENDRAKAAWAAKVTKDTANAAWAAARAVRAAWVAKAARAAEAAKAAVIATTAAGAAMAAEAAADSAAKVGNESKAKVEQLLIELFEGGE